MMSLRINIWTKLVMVLSLMFSVFSLGAFAQDKPMAANALAGLITDLKEVVSKNSPVENDALLVGKKWDARKDLNGKTKSAVIDLLWIDVKSVIKNSGVQYQIYSIFSFYKQIPDKSFAKSFLDLTEQEKSDFVAAKIDEITTKMSGKTFAFNADFKLQVSRYVDGYAKRVGTNRKTGFFADDLNFVLQRGGEYAPMINSVFDKHGISRLSGLYMAMIESEFNANAVSPTGSLGIFQFNKMRAQKYKLPAKDRNNTGKAADAAARYLKDNQDYFAEHKMKEFLAILSWNREPKKINFDLSFKFMADSENIACPICGLFGSPNRFDKQFQTEAFKYIPKFLAAAIVGENPNDFGLNTKPLSTIET